MIVEMFRKFCDGLGNKTNVEITSTVLGLKGYTAAITASLGTTAVIGYEGASGGGFILPAGSTITSLTWYVSDDASGTFMPAQDATGSAVTQTVAASKAYPIPDALFGYGALKAVGDAAGNVLFCMKS